MNENVSLDAIAREICKYLDSIASKYDLDGESMLEVLDKTTTHYTNPVVFNFLDLNAEYSRRVNSETLTSLMRIEEPLMLPSSSSSSDIVQLRPSEPPRPERTVRPRSNQQRNSNCSCIPFEPDLSFFNKQLRADERYVPVRNDQLCDEDRVLCWMNIKSGRIVEGIVVGFTLDKRPYVKRLMSNGGYTDEKRPTGCKYNQHIIVYKAVSKSEAAEASNWENLMEQIRKNDNSSQSSCEELLTRPQRNSKRPNSDQPDEMREVKVEKLH